MSAAITIGAYEVLRLIARGGQGSVYLGYDQRLQRRVAIKVHALPGERVARRRLLEQAQLVARIDNPRVVQIHDVVVAQNHLALVMEYVPGCDLEAVLAGPRLSLVSILRIANELAGTIALARREHLVHGDLKASNVLITQAGTLKLTDFGIARDTLTQSAGRVGPGSLSSISPEQLGGQPLDVRSDLFALGCLIYRMLTGRHPFARAGCLDAQAVLDFDPPRVIDLVANVPLDLSELVADLLQKSPGKRPRDTHQVRYRLRSILRSIPVTLNNPLLIEAQPFLREESSDELPPLVPEDLQRHGRSRLLPFRPFEWASWRRGVAALWPWKLSGLLAGLSLLFIAVAWQAMQPAQVHIHVARPMIAVEGNPLPPRQVSPEWLVERVAEAARDSLGVVVVSGPVGSTPITAVREDGWWDTAPVVHHLQVDLRCRHGLCVIDLARESGSREYREQVVLFAGASTPEWLAGAAKAGRLVFDNASRVQR